jgi:hypothetical protein
MDIGSSDLFKNSRKTGVTAASHTSELVAVREIVLLLFLNLDGSADFPVSRGTTTGNRGAFWHLGVTSLI